MGLFSKKKESHTIEEALKNHDKNFSYTTRTGYTYDDFPYMMQHTLWNNICATSFDDAFEMYAPNFLATIEETYKNLTGAKSNASRKGSFLGKQGFKSGTK